MATQQQAAVPVRHPSRTTSTPVADGTDEMRLRTVGALPPLLRGWPGLPRARPVAVDATGSAE